MLADDVCLKSNKSAVTPPLLVNMKFRVFACGWIVVVILAHPGLSRRFLRFARADRVRGVHQRSEAPTRPVSLPLSWNTRNVSVGGTWNHRRQPDQYRPPLVCTVCVTLMPLSPSRRTYEIRLELLQQISMYKEDLVPPEIPILHRKVARAVNSTDPLSTLCSDRRGERSLQPSPPDR